MALGTRIGMIRCWLVVVLEEAVVGVRGEALKGKMRKRSGKGAWLP